MSRARTIHLGFEVGTGNSVSIPVGHMVVAGQTQQAGKTTTLEALISRAELPAVAFVTKRGEQSFQSGRKIQPYFRDRADWQFVASVLEATMRERLKFERAWIIRASKGARTLADVHENVRELMTKAKGLSADVYLQLDEYLKIVVPRIDQVTFADTVDISQTGLHILDLSNRATFPPELQSLVIRSVLEWVYEHSRDTITIIPEAWEFIPQGRGSPVKLAAIELIRKGAGLGNFVWNDSQDIGGIDKELLRSCTVWLLGVQREANEIKRTLDNIPAGIAKPKAGEIATLERGQFYACFGNKVIKTYVQPAWMGLDEAQTIAAGGKQRTFVSPAFEAPEQLPEKLVEREKTVTTREANDLATTNHNLTVENERLRDRIAAFEAKAGKPEHNTKPETNGDTGDLYDRILARLLKEPAILKLNLSKPEIEVTVTRKTVQIDEFSLKGRIARLLKDGFFKEPRGCSAIRTALKRTGPDCNTGNIGRSMDDFTKDGFTTDEGSGYREVEGMKVNVIKQ